MHDSLMEICDDGLRFTRLLWHISVFHSTISNGCSSWLHSFVHFLKIMSSTVSNISTRHQDGCKAKQYSPSAFAIITRSYLSQCLGQHSLFQGGERGLMDEGNLSCFSELNKNIQLRFTSLLSAGVRLGAPSIPVNTSALR